MNGRPDWADVAEASRLRAEDEAEARETAHAQVYAEIALLVDAGFRGVPCKLPRVSGVSRLKVVHDVDLRDAITEALSDEEFDAWNLMLSTLTGAVITSGQVSAEAFKAAIVSSHMKWHGDGLIEERLQ